LRCFSGLSLACLYHHPLKLLQDIFNLQSVPLLKTNASNGASRVLSDLFEFIRRYSAATHLASACIFMKGFWVPKRVFQLVA
jgi:hypothetical protein